MLFDNLLVFSWLSNEIDLIAVYKFFLQASEENKNRKRGVSNRNLFIFIIVQLSLQFINILSCYFYHFIFSILWRFSVFFGISFPPHKYISFRKWKLARDFCEITHPYPISEISWKKIDVYRQRKHLHNN